MKILFLSFYFPPDLSAGSFRSSSLVNSLLTGWPKEVKIELITTLPNRYSSFVKDASASETLPGLTIHRIAIDQHNSSIFGQCKGFVTYFKGVTRHIADNDYDMVFATSGRLMTAILGSHVARKLKKPLYIDIRDIFVDTIYDVLPLKVGVILSPLFSALERYAMNSAGKINLVSAGFLPYFKQRYAKKEFEVFTNGIDDQFLDLQPKRTLKKKQIDQLTVVYAGNIGDGQGLHNIIPGLAKKFQGKLLFKIIGDGSRTHKLTLALKSLGCQNVVILPPVRRDKLIAIYNSADILFLHVNDFTAFKKVLPSKLFEYAATGKPIWAGVAGYAAEFISSKIENSAVFAPCNTNAAILAFENLKMVTYPRKEFKNEFSRGKIMEKMAQSLINFCQNS